MTHKHIEHYEDLTFNPAQLRNILAEVAAGRAEFSIKYDGAPAIVFGHLDGKTFIATKSYFNVEPIFFTDSWQIDEKIKNVDLAEKLKSVLRVLQHIDNRPEEGNVYFGDLLFCPYTTHWSRITDFNQTVTPNVIRYNFPDALGMRMGVAIHDQLLGDEPYKGSEVYQPQMVFTPRVFPTPLLPAAKDLQILQYRLDMVTDIVPTFFIDFMNWMIRVDRLLNRINKRDIYAFFEASTQKAMSERKTQKGKQAVYDRIQRFAVPLQDIDYVVLNDVYQAVMLSKRLLQQTVVPKADSYSNPSAYCRELGWSHEGIVVKTEHGSFKVVDRAKFRAANNALNIKKRLTQ